MASHMELIGRLEKGPGDYASAIQGVSEAILSRRPDEKNWAAKEIICHMRDIEELSANRFQAILGMERPKLFPVEMDRWARDRQYIRNDALEALASFRTRREENIKLLRELKPEQWERVGIHATRGPLTVKDCVEHLVTHDESHVQQLKRALAGQA